MVTLGEVDAATLRGLAAAAEALLGPDPVALCDGLARWYRRYGRELPWLAGPALSLLDGITAEDVVRDADAAAVGRFLVGAEHDPARALAAAFACRRRADAVTSGELPGDDDRLVDALWRGALVAAVERFFVLLTDVYAQLHAPLRDGRRNDAQAIIDAAAPGLESAAGRIGALATRIGGGGDGAALARTDVMPRAVPPAAPRPAPQVLLSSSGPPPPPLLARRPPRREHAGLALAFVVVALAVAVVLLQLVLTGLPLTADGLRDAVRAYVTDAVSRF